MIQRLAATLAVCVLAGCETGERLPRLGPAPAPAAATSRTPANDGLTVSDRPAAIVDGQSVTWAQLQPRLAEAAGGQILDEVILERALERDLAQSSIVVTAEALAAEESAALEALDGDPLRAEQLLASLRSAQGLGSERWKALLYRNAALRALARRDSTISEENIRQAYDTLHGPRRVCRLIVVADLPAAEKVKSRLANGETFADVAALASTDSSAARGGLLAPIAREDPSYPPAFREALFTLAPSARSELILLENGYAIVELREELKGDGADPAQARAECERVARRAQERVEMDRIARALVRGAKTTIFEAHLEGSWKAQREGASTP